MARELIESWTDYLAAVDRLLPLARRQLCIYDEDLARLGLENSGRQEHLGQLLTNAKEQPLRIALRDGAHFQNRSPRLQRLLTPWMHRAEVRQTPPDLAGLRDSMIIVDARHALVRLEKNLPRSVLLIDDTLGVMPYLERFEEIWQASRKNLLQTPLGL
ncbi:hypothetical protein ACLIIZ_18315 [Azonexus caeni]|jgi:hypothetical protein|uniref:DUF7931 domain-containing protein n=1 Tax=Azonexus caeni TaxID=266126 RepID=UPI003A8C0A4F